MLSEQRLHPVSVVFALAKSLKAFAVPAVLVLFGVTTRSAGPGGDSFGFPPFGWERWAIILLVPATASAIARYLSFRLRYEGNELVVRWGILFRNERHIPYARIQNLNAVRNVFHRLLGMIEVQVETGAGKRPEATISVIRVAAYEEMRRRVFEGRSAPAHGAGAESATDRVAAPAAREEILLRLPWRELVLHGVIQNRALVPLGAAYGLLWQYGLLDGLGARLFGEGSYAGGIARDLGTRLARGGSLPLGEVGLALAGVVGFVVLMQAFSIGWAIIRLHGFHLVRVGEDLRTEYGLLTRVVGTIPVRRVQTMTIRQGVLQRFFNRASVRVDTAGGGSSSNEAGTKEREWLAPIIRVAEVPALVRIVFPEFDEAALAWQRPHPQAFRRAVKPAVFTALCLSAGAALMVGVWALAALVGLTAWGVFSTRREIHRLAWGATEDVVAFRSGWLRQQVTVARVVKIQAVTLLESPFDRRWGMSGVRVDTAGAGQRSHRIDIRYLARDVARELHASLALRAANTVFRW